MRRCRATPDCWISTASTSACTGRSPAPSVSTIRRRVESARTSNTTDSTGDAYTYVYIHFSAFLGRLPTNWQPPREGCQFGCSHQLEHKAHAECRLNQGPRAMAWSGQDGVRREREELWTSKQGSVAGWI